MDNRHIDLSLKGKEDFAAAMRLALNSKETVGYRLYENEMTLFWSKTSAGDGFKELPYSMFPDDVINFVWGWLESVSPMSPKPVHDGDNEQAFRIYTDVWGHGKFGWQSFVNIKPIWAMHGK